MNAWGNLKENKLEKYTPKPCQSNPIRGCLCTCVQGLDYMDICMQAVNLHSSMYVCVPYLCLIRMCKYTHIFTYLLKIFF